MLSGKVQTITATQRLAFPVQAAQLFSTDGGSGAENPGRRKTAGCGQVAADAVDRRMKYQLLTPTYRKAAPRAEWCLVKGRGQISAGQGESAVLLTVQDQAAQGYFYHCACRVIAQQPICPVSCDPVQCAALGNTDMPHTEAATILQLR